MTKYGRPALVVPPSSTRAMLGWSISASACRSASKRAITCWESIPALISLTATRRFTGAVCCAIQTVPMPPSPICSSSLYGPITVPVRSVIESSTVTAGGLPCSKKLPRWACSSSRATMRRRSSWSPAQASSRKASRSAASGNWRAAVKMSRSFMAHLLLDPSSLQCGFRPPIAQTFLRLFRGRALLWCIESEHRGDVGPVQALPGSGALPCTVRIPRAEPARIPALIAGEMTVQPRTGISPGVVSGSDRNVERLGDFLHRQADEETQFHQVGRHGIDGREVVQDVVDRQRFLDIAGRRDAGFVQFVPTVLAAALRRMPSPGLIDEDAAHGLGSGGEEVAAAIPPLHLLGVHQPQIGLVDQSGRLEGLAWFLLGQLLGRQLAQLIVDQRQELLGGVGVALLDGGQDLGDFAHVGQFTPREPARLDRRAIEAGRAPIRESW